MSGITNALSALEERGLVAQTSDSEGIRSVFRDGRVAIYVGFDPTAASLHVGHLLPVIVLSRLQQLGHQPIVLVGGATGMIGDPSGKTDERELLTPEQVQENIQGVQAQLERFVEFGGSNAALIVNNGDWIPKISYIDWLRDIGKHFSVNYMIAKESVRKRLNEREHGISYTEFSYMLMQAYDFLYLYDNYGCRIQGGGNDQWGNITAGIELIRRMRRTETYGITFPLMTTASGQKFGKSEGNAVWLDPALTSPYAFYQYWLQSDDRDVARYLKCFTFLDIDEIADLMTGHEANPDVRTAQRALAREMTRTVHGEDGMARAERAAAALFGQGLEELTEAEIREVFASAPSGVVPSCRLGGMTVSDLLAEVGACKSKSAARRLAEQGGAYLNGERISDPNRIVTSDDLLSGGRYIVLRTGKRNHYLVDLG